MTDQPDPPLAPAPRPDRPDGEDRAPGARRAPLPPDPAAYDDPRSEMARARGLEAPYIAGGRDPDPESARREERRYGKLLLAMVIVIILSGFVLGIIGNLITAAR